tara:strand:- start:26601 stop:27269 length:669 start_codon:yes stop_codon:yes gene_type:complete
MFDNIYVLYAIILVLIIVLHNKISLDKKKNIGNKNGYVVGEPNKEDEFVSPYSSNHVDKYRHPEDTYKRAWTNKNNTQHPENHNSKLASGFINPGEFFNNKDKMYTDITSPYSDKSIPDRCNINGTSIYCSFNDRLQSIPPKLIDEENNKTIQNIGDDNDIFTNVTGDKVVSIDNNYYNTSDDGKTINGGVFFEGVVGHGSISSMNMDISDLNGEELSNYSI